MTGEPSATAPPDRPDDQGEPAAAPEYGPPGYLPGRAARRARKIVLRAELGLGWVVAAVVAGVVLLAVGVWFLAAEFGPPGPPFVEVAAATDLAGGEVVRVRAHGDAVLLVRARGRLRAFRAPATPVHYCPDSGRLEGADGTVWGLDGDRLSRDGDSLAELPLAVHTGTVYVDPTASTDASAPREGGATPACPPPTG